MTLVLGGKYRLLERIGVGGHAEVYLAEQLALERKVALKVISRQGPAVPEADARFKREALIHASIEHPSIVKLLDFEAGGPEGAVVVMEYVPGTPLHQRLAHGGLTATEAMPLLLQLAEGLSAIHERGVVHRDLKAENVMLAQTPNGVRARILDFGLARLFDADAMAGDGRSFISSHGMVSGTPAYVAPELLRGLPPDPRSDVYAFGVTAHFMLSGVLPFQGPDLSDFMKQHLDVKPPPLPSDVPTELSALVLQCLEKEPSKRPPGGTALANALRSLELAPPVARRPRSSGVGLGVLATLVLVGAPLVAIERPWEPATQARWLIRLGRAEDALTTDVAGRALALEALGRTDELKSLIERECLALATALEPAERRRLGVALSACQ